VNTQANIKGNSPMSVQSGNAYNGRDACEWHDRQQCAYYPTVQWSRIAV